MMRQMITVAVMGILACLSSCKQDEVEKYDATAQIYFYDENNGKLKDSTLLSFAQLEPSTTELTFEIPIRYIGALSSNDRPYSVRIVADGTTAVEGRDFVLFPEKYVVKGGQATAVLPVRLLSNPQLDSRILQIVLQLIPNDYFKTDFQFTNIDLNEIDLSTYRVLFSNMLMRPSWWDSSTELYLGDFSKRKLDLIEEVTAVSIKDLEKARGEYNWDFIRSVARQTQIQINYSRSIGEEILDENGVPVNMGVNINK